MYRIEFSSSAAKEFRELTGELKKRVGVVVDKLSENPRPTGVRKLAVSEKLYRVRVGDYRIVYEINDGASAIRITRIRHRKEAYR